MIYKLNPELDSITGIQAQQQALVEVLPQAWQQIQPEIVQEVLNSMPRRLQAVIDAQGWQTKY
jgi:hypothetical protein